MATESSSNEVPAARTARTKTVTAVKSAARKTVVPATKTAAVKAPAPQPVSATGKAGKIKKTKLVRDSFTIPKDEYVVIDLLKVRAGKLGQPVKKSELLRAGIKVLAALSDIQFKAALSSVPTIKTGRPKDVK